MEGSGGTVQTEADKTAENSVARKSEVRARFNKAALTVLSQVYDQKSLDTGANNDGGKPPRDELTPRKSRVNLVSVVKAVRLRKAASQKDENLEAPLPERPRWCATLSSEAQVAMMTCYQDKLIEGLQGAFPDQTKSLVRVSTPSSMQLARRNSPPSIPHRSTKRPSDPKVLQKRKISGTFETAMHILDQLKESRGENTTSRPPPAQTAAPPVTRYNHWATKWETVLVPEDDETAPPATD